MIDYLNTLKGMVSDNSKNNIKDKTTKQRVEIINEKVRD